MGYPGANTRQFEFDVKIRKEGDRLAKMRARVGAKIRRECKRRLADVRLDKLMKYLKRGRQLKGSRMALDVRTAEAVIKRRYILEEVLLSSLFGGLGECGILSIPSYTDCEC